jgi:hypothetical protein
MKGTIKEAKTKIRILLNNSALYCMGRHHIYPNISRYYSISHYSIRKLCLDAFYILAHITITVPRAIYSISRRALYRSRNKWQTTFKQINPSDGQFRFRNAKENISFCWQCSMLVAFLTIETRKRRLVFRCVNFYANMQALSKGVGNNICLLVSVV